MCLSKTVIRDTTGMQSRQRDNCPQGKCFTAPLPYKTKVSTLWLAVEYQGIQCDLLDKCQVCNNFIISHKARTKWHVT